MKTTTFDLNAFNSRRGELERALMMAFDRAAATVGDEIRLLDWFTLNATFNNRVREAMLEAEAPVL